MGVFELIEDMGGCEGGKFVYNRAKDLTKARNILKKYKRLTDRTINCLRGFYPHVDLSRVRYKVRCSLPGNWFTRENNYGAITFGYKIFFKDRDVQKREDMIHLLMHELFHIEQMERLGSQDQFACEYGKGFLQADGDYATNPLEKEAYDFQNNNPVPTQCYDPPAKLVWWEKKDFKGTRHTRYLYPADHGKKIKLRHNDAMKSLKFYGQPYWELGIYDSPSCKKNDDYGIVIFPARRDLDCVEVPRIGRQGINKVNPPGLYRFHYVNGLPGKVSSIKHWTVEDDIHHGPPPGRRTPPTRPPR